MDYKAVTDQFAVAPQITADDVTEIKNLGYAAIINNRPDDEVPGQPRGEEIRAAAEAQGLGYYDIQIQSGTLSPESVEATRETIAAIEGPAFAYCRTGTRSITLWALSQIGQQDGHQILKAVKDAGYDLPFLEQYLQR